MPEAADRALVSVATAYRYFSSAEDLWWEATQRRLPADLRRNPGAHQAAGPDPQARTQAAVRSNSFAMIDDPVPFRRIAQIALELWFRQRDPADDREIPNRAGRRNELISEVLSPLGGTLPEREFDRIANALGLVLGTEAMIALIDAVGLDAPTAKDALLDAAVGFWPGARGAGRLRGAHALISRRSETAQPEPATISARVDL